MGKVFKSYFQVQVCWLFRTMCKLMVGKFQTLLCEPFLRGDVKKFQEVADECRPVRYANFCTGMLNIKFFSIKSTRSSFAGSSKSASTISTASLLIPQRYYNLWV